MAPSLLSGSSSSALQHFDIRPEQDHLVLRGTQHEAPAVILKGVVVLCNTEPLKAQDVSLRLTGEARTAFTYMTAAPSSRAVKQESEFFRHDWQFDIKCPHKAGVIPAGNHEWPFEAVIPGNLPESIEGCYGSWVVYRLKAVVDRGRFARNLEARQHIRLIRTFDASSLELAYAMSLKNVWPDKIAYNISTPQKGIAFGSQVQVDFELAPLLKGLRIGKIRTIIKETILITVELRGEPNRTREYTREIATDEYDLPEDMETQDIDGVEGYVLSRHLQLPRSLQACIQTASEQNIEAKHQLKFNVLLHNPDGHLSELRAHLPIHIYIPPIMRVNSTNQVEIPANASAAVLDNRMTPPSYGEHKLDMLYSDVDPQWFATPASSQLPSRDQSRRGSNENIQSLVTEEDREVSANTLHNRLATLQFQPGATAEPSTSHHSDGARRTSESEPSDDSRRGSQGQSDHSSASNTEPQHVEFNREALSRVPSYNTALHVSTRTPATSDLPDYRTATSRPPSPVQSAGEAASGSSPSETSGFATSERHARFAHETDDLPSDRRRGHRNLQLRTILR